MLRRWAAPATAVGLSLGFALVWLRVVYLQVVQAEQYRQQLQRQAFARVLLLPERGTILDRRGEPLALSVKAPSYAVDPQQLRCAECLCRAAHALGLDSATCLQRIRSARGRFLWLLRSVWERPTTALDTLSDPGLIRLQELHRVYPYGELTLPLLGSVNIDQVGISGVELSYDSLLRMPPVETLMRRDARGRLIPVPQSAAHSPPQPPMLRTTLDIELQQLIAYELQRGLERFRARSGVAIALEVHSGAIRAAVALPTPARGSATLPVVGEVYEPGSVLKPFIAAAALDQGYFAPKTRSMPATGNGASWDSSSATSTPWGGRRFAVPLRSPAISSSPSLPTGFLGACSTGTFGTSALGFPRAWTCPARSTGLSPLRNGWSPPHRCFGASAMGLP
jgi:cell division protein FtsI (penicillin-binding protein 3)